MPVQRRLEQLRGLLYDAPSAPTWRAITDLFDAWPDLESLADGIAYADAHLVRWPDAARTVPALWRLRLLSGATSIPLLRLARRLVLEHTPTDRAATRFLTD